MRLILLFIFVIVSHFMETDQTIIRSSLKIDKNLNWILHPPWKHRNDLFNDKPYNNSVEYFGINKEDYITNESYIESSKIIVCNEVNLTFYSKVNSSHNNIKLMLFMYQQNKWIKQWEYIHNMSQWQFHQLKINMTGKNEDTQFRFIPFSNSSSQIFIAIAILNITTQTNCRQLNSQLKPHSRHGSDLGLHPFLFVIFGSVFLLIFITIMAIFIYGFVNKHYNQWRRKRSSRRRKKGWKTRNVIRDESTVLGVEMDIV